MELNGPDSSPSLPFILVLRGDPAHLMVQPLAKSNSPAMVGHNDGSPGTLPGSPATLAGPEMRAQQCTAIRRAHMVSPELCVAPLLLRGILSAEASEAALAAEQPSRAQPGSRRESRQRAPLGALLAERPLVVRFKTRSLKWPSLARWDHFAEGFSKPGVVMLPHRRRINFTIHFLPL